MDECGFEKQIFVVATRNCEKWGGRRPELLIQEETSGRTPLSSTFLFLTRNLHYARHSGHHTWPDWANAAIKQKMTHQISRCCGQRLCRWCYLVQFPRIDRWIFNCRIWSRQIPHQTQSLSSKTFGTNIFGRILGNCGRWGSLGKARISGATCVRVAGLIGVNV